MPRLGLPRRRFSDLAVVRALSKLARLAMHIIHVVPFYLPATRYGGPVHSVHGLCKALVRLGHDVDVFTTNIDGPGESAVPLGAPVVMDGVRVHYFRSPRLRRLVWTPSLVHALARALRRDSVVHLHMVFTFPTTAVARVAQLMRVPYIVSPRGVLVQSLVQKKSSLVKRAWLRAFDRQTLARAARIHVTSEVEQRELAAFGLTLPPLVMAPNGVDVPSVLPGPSGPEREAYGVFLGRISWKKGLDRALHALVHTRARLCIVGGDDEDLRPELEQLAMRLGVSDRVAFLGQRDGAEKWRLLRGARFLLLPSYNENFGNVVVEAMGVGVPVIVTPEVGAAEIVAAAQAGYVVAGEPHALGAAMERLWRDEVLGEQLGRRGECYVRERLSWDAVGRAFSGVYAQL